MELKLLPIQKSPVEWMDEVIFFFLDYQNGKKPLLEHYKNNPDFIQPESRKMK